MVKNCSALKECRDIPEKYYAVATHQGSPKERSLFACVIDYMIEDGKLEPMIVVTPTFYNNIDKNGNRTEDDIAGFYQELQDIIIPQIETKYHTFYGNSIDNLEDHYLFHILKDLFQ